MRNKKGAAIVIAMILSCIMAMISCTHNSGVTPEVSFSKDIIPIFTSYCTLNSSCHLGANATNLEITLDSGAAYNCIISKGLVRTDDPRASLLYVEVNSNEMPVPPAAPLPAADQSLILYWIEQGAKNN